MVAACCGKCFKHSSSYLSGAGSTGARAFLGSLNEAEQTSSETCSRYSAGANFKSDRTLAGTSGLSLALLHQCSTRAGI